MSCFHFLRRRQDFKRRACRFYLIKDQRASAAVEFAIIAPVFFLMVIGMLGFGIYLGAVHSVRQLTSDVARATISGVSETERQSIADNFIKMNIDKYAFIKIDKVKVDVKESAAAANQTIIEVSYDASELPIWEFVDIVPMPSQDITASAAIVNGGYAQ